MVITLRLFENVKIDCNSYEISYYIATLNTLKTIMYDLESTIRLDQWCCQILNELSRSQIQKNIKSGYILVNKKTVKASTILKKGDQISLPDLTVMSTASQTLSTEEELQPTAMPLTILAEEEHYLVLDKASGTVVHPAPGHNEQTIVHGILWHCGNHFQQLATNAKLGEKNRPGIVHRLDKDTSGCLLIAKTPLALHAFKQQFQQRTTKKIYLCVVDGIPQQEQGTIENYLGRHPKNRKKRAIISAENGKLAVTQWQVLHRDKQRQQTLIRCHILTGRTHQIRVHMRYLGHPIIGDVVYSNAKKKWSPKQQLLLHAWQLSFNHPVTQQQLHYSAAIPPHMYHWHHEITSS